MADKEVEIAGKTIGENSKISLTVKNLFWVVSILFGLLGSAAGVGYFDIKDDVRTYKDKVDEEKKEFVKEVTETLDDRLDRMMDKDDKLTESITSIKVDIAKILERTRPGGGTPIGTAPTTTEGEPSGDVPTL